MGRIATGWLMLFALVGCGGDDQQQSPIDPISESGVFIYQVVVFLKSDDRSNPENGRSGAQVLIENIESMEAADMGKYADKYATIIKEARELEKQYGRLVDGETVARTEIDQKIDELIAVAITLPGAHASAVESEGHKHD